MGKVVWDAEQGWHDGGAEATLVVVDGVIVAVTKRKEVT
jgi:hypothetical protein